MVLKKTHIMRFQVKNKQKDANLQQNVCKQENACNF